MTAAPRYSRFLLFSNILCWLALGTLTVYLLSGRSHLRVGELEASRINVVGEGNEPVMTLAGKGRLPGPRINGREFPPEIAEPRTLVSGLIFFNEEGDEVGGLIYNGFQIDTTYTAVGHLSFDQWKQNQVVALQYLDNRTTRRAGLRVWDRPTEVQIDRQLDLLTQIMNASGAERDSLRALATASRERGDSGTERMFVGSENRSAKVELRDSQGQVRVRLLVDSNDLPRLEFLDASGALVAVYPPQAG